MYGEPPEPPEWVIDLQVFEDNVKDGWARIQQRIAEAQERLGKYERMARSHPHDLGMKRAVEDEKAYLRGVMAAVKDLIETMGTDEAFKREK